MNILETIYQYKLKEVEERKKLYTIADLEKSNYFKTHCYSLKNKLKNNYGIIAEFKRKSPSKGNINTAAKVIDVTKGYVKNGAAALSVLTDEHFFGAEKKDVELARIHNQVPLLRKDFMIDEYQLIESKAMGADVILIIAKLISINQAKALSKQAKLLGLEVFLETHSAQEIETYLEIEPDLIGINNRNLNSFEVSIETSIQLAKLIPADIIKIAESGIQSTETIKRFIENGFNGFLIGEYFMKHENPDLKCLEFNQFIQQFSLETPLK
jgi:indole-3-glycerol phosphate synthase